MKKLKLFEKVKFKLSLRSSEKYIKYLRSKGVEMGGGNFIRDPKTFKCDIQRASLITIGDNNRFNLNTSLICHDASAKVFRIVFNDYLPSNGRITIGNNCWFARNVTLLKGADIGDNCIIGYGSTVMGRIPSNSVAAGTPAKVISSLEDYYTKRKEKSLEESFEFARSIKERYGRMPEPKDFFESFVWFVDGKDIEKYPDIPIKHQLGPCYYYYKEHHKAKFESFEDFLRAAEVM